MTFHKAEDTIFLQQVSLKTLKLPKWAKGYQNPGRFQQ